VRHLALAMVIGVTAVFAWPYGLRSSQAPGLTPRHLPGTTTAVQFRLSEAQSRWNQAPTVLAPRRLTHSRRANLSGGTPLLRTIYVGGTMVAVDEVTGRVFVPGGWVMEARWLCWMLLVAASCISFP
jgi:hypothetical protein